MIIILKSLYKVAGIVIESRGIRIRIIRVPGLGNRII